MGTRPTLAAATYRYLVQLVWYCNAFLLLAPLLHHIPRETGQEFQDMDINKSRKFTCMYVTLLSVTSTYDHVDPLFEGSKDGQ